jgi:hypothetical protein
MIHEEICTYEVAKLAKEKGFDVPTHYAYNENCQKAMYMELCLNRNTKDSRSISAPTQSLLQLWLREEKGITICVDIFDDGWFFDISTFYKQDTGIYEVDIPYKSSNVSPVYDTYELALEDALKYVLKNLV